MPERIITDEELERRARELEENLLNEIAADLKINHGEQRTLKVRERKEYDEDGIDWPVRALVAQVGTKFSLLKLRRVPRFECLIKLEYASEDPRSWVKVHSFDPRMESYRERFQTVAAEIGRSHFGWSTYGYSVVEESG